MTDCDLPRNPVRPLLHLKCSWLKRRVSKHCISHVLPCLVSGCASCMIHNDKWPSDPLLFCRLYYIPAMVKNDFQTKWSSGWSRFSWFTNTHCLTTTVYWTKLVHICSTWNPWRKPTHLHLSYLKDSTRIITSKNQSWRANPQGLQDLAVKCCKMWIQNLYIWDTN